MIIPFKDQAGGTVGVNPDLVLNVVSHEKGGSIVLMAQSIGVVDVLRVFLADDVLTVINTLNGTTQRRK